MTKTSHPAKPATASRRRVQHANAGLVIGLIDDTRCWVTFPDNPSAQAQEAVLLAHVGPVRPGCSVLLQFLGGDATQPVVTGVLRHTPSEGNASAKTTRDDAGTEFKLDIDGTTLTLKARDRLALRCGKASLVMHADGTIELRGTDLLSRSSGQNAIRGASITLN